MATSKQIAYYEYLCEQACIEPEDDYKDEHMEIMSAKIKELIAIVNGER